MDQVIKAIPFSDLTFNSMMLRRPNLNREGYNKQIKNLQISKKIHKDEIFPFLCLDP